MLPLAFGVSMLHFPSLLMGRDYLVRTTHAMAVSLCQPYRGSKRYKQMVDYYQWKLERRYERSMTYKSYAFCHDALVWWTVLYQLLRLAQLAEAMMSGMR